MSARVRVEIDLNTRVRGQLTLTGIEDADGPVEIGQSVTAYESEDDIAAPAIVVDVDRDKHLIYLAVAWREFDDDRTVPAIACATSDSSGDLCKTVGPHDTHDYDLTEENR